MSVSSMTEKHMAPKNPAFKVWLLISNAARHPVDFKFTCPNVKLVLFLLIKFLTSNLQIEVLL
jgi:hypothetical protein